MYDPDGKMCGLKDSDMFELKPDELVDSLPSHNDADEQASICGHRKAMRLLVDDAGMYSISGRVK